MKHLHLVRRMGRTAARRGGGVYRSGLLITEALQELGVTVTCSSDKEPGQIPKNAELVWVYGSIECVPNILKQGKRVLVNSTFDNTPDRAKAMIARSREWGDDAFFNVFTLEAEHSPLLDPIRPQVIAVPKTIRVKRGGASLPFSQRRGICLGEIGKAMRSRLVRGLDFEQIVKSLQEIGPLTAIGHYNDGEHAPANIDIVPYMDSGFLQWLGGHRLFVSVVAHETFAMVPMEAQVAGTPVLYRHMPQSLSGYIGFTGVPYRSVEELSRAAKRLYEDERFWGPMSEAGLLNGQARGVGYAGSSLYLSLAQIAA